MYTCCPQCQTVFKLSAQQLSMAHGHVRCGRCGEVYDAIDHISDELDEDGELPACYHTDRPPTISNSTDEADPLHEDLFLSRAPDPLAADPEPELLPLEEEAAAMLQPAPRRSWDAGWILGCLLLTLALIGQYGWTEQQQWAQNDRIRPWVQRACDMLGCQLPMREDLSQFRLVSRDIRPHPSVADALIISATMQNRATFLQPYPVVEILLSDLTGKRIAMRRFTPDEYLENAENKGRGLPPGTLLPMVFEVVDPGQNAVAFEFSFR